MTAQPPPIDALLKIFPQVLELKDPKVGGFKTVFRAKMKKHDEAFKVVQLPPSSNDELGMAFRKESLGRIRREVEALGKCGIPELVKLASIPPTEVSIAGNDYVVYSEEYLEGADLRALIQQARKQPPTVTEKQLGSLMLSLLHGIKELWGHGYIHRDIKPANVVQTLDKSRPFVLLDLGIAFSIQETALTYNPQHRILATWRYMAPERAYPDQRDNIDYRSDLYSAAVTVYEYGANNHPYARDFEDDLATISRAISEPPKPLKSYRPDLSDGFCQTIDQLLRKKPALRPGNMTRLIAMMEALS